MNGFVRRSWAFRPIFLFFVLGVLPCRAFAQWTAVGDGLEIFTVGALVAVKADPNLYEIVVLSAKVEGKGPQPADKWAHLYDLVLVVNAGMFTNDYSPIGFLRAGGREVTRRWRKSYGAALLAGPTKPEMPQAMIADIACEGPLELVSRPYLNVVQGMRMLTCHLENTFMREKRSACRLALGIDSDGRLLFLFHLAPVTGRDFVSRIRMVFPQISRVMYLEGGSEASLYLRSHSGDIRLSGVCGVLCSLFSGKGLFVPIPNVIGLRPRSEKSKQRKPVRRLRWKLHFETIPDSLPRDRQEQKV